MRFLLLLPFVLVACTTAMKAAHRGPASTYEDDLAKLGPISPEMKAKLISAVEDMLNAGMGETHRGQHLMSINVESVDLLRTLGVPEEVIVKKVTQRLDAFLEQGRREGLQRSEKRFEDFLPENIRETGVSADPSAVPEENSFIAKYDLTPYKNLRRHIGRVDGFRMASTYYATSTDTAFDLAMTIHNEYLADQAIFQSLQLEDYGRAYLSAEKMKDESSLIHIGFLALTDYYFGKNTAMSRTNTLWHAVEAFKRVQGPLKPKANRLMIDLAKDLAFEKTLTKNLEHQEKALYALKLLRSTGKLIARVPIDSVKYNFVTKVEEPEVVELIRKVLPMISDTKADEVIEALASIGAKDMISRIALAELLKRKNPRHGNYQFIKALKLYEIAEDQEGIRRVLNEMMGEDAGVIADYQITAYVIPGILAIDGPKGLERVLAMIDGQIQLAKGGPEKSRLEWAKEELEKAIAANDFSRYADRESRRATPPPVKRENELVSSYEWLKSQIAKQKGKHTPEQIAEFKKKAQEALANENSWEAFNLALSAMSIPELIIAGDNLVKAHNGNNALRPYLAAIVLQQAK